MSRSEDLVYAYGPVLKVVAVVGVALYATIFVLAQRADQTFVRILPIILVPGAVALVWDTWFSKVWLLDESVRVRRYSRTRQIRFDEVVHFTTLQGRVVMRDTSGTKVEIPRGLGDKSLRMVLAFEVSNRAGI